MAIGKKPYAAGTEKQILDGKLSAVDFVQQLSDEGPGAKAKHRLAYNAIFTEDRMQRIAMRLTRLTVCGVAALTAQTAMADSVYDGIWQYEGGAYFSLTITGEQAVLVSLSDVANYQDPLKGTYIGTVTTNVGTSYPTAVLRAYVKTELKPADRFFFSWGIYFFSKRDAVMARPVADYPTAGVGPYLPLRKIF